MRKYVLVALVLCVLGVGVSLLLIPTQDEVVMLQQRDVAQIDLGNIDLQAEYNQGRRSFPIVNGLAEEKVDQGDRPAAIALFEEYVRANPKDVNGRKALAQHYLLLGDMQKYNAQLEEIAVAEPNETNLKVLSGIYNAEGNYQKQAETLQKLIDVTEGNNPQYYVDLATIQALLNNFDGQIATIQTLRAKHPHYITYPTTRIYVDAMSRQKNTAQALNAAESWMASNPQDADGLADLMNILHYTGASAQSALTLAEPRLNLLPKSPPLVNAYVNVNITLGREDVAYNTLQQVEEAGSVPPELYGRYFELAVRREDTKTSDRLIKTLNGTQFSEIEALNLIELSRTTLPKKKFEQMVKRFDQEDALVNKPALAAVVAILMKDKQQDARINAALSVHLQDIQRLRLGQTCARHAKTACFEGVVQQFPPVAQMTPFQLEEFAELHIQAGNASALVDQLTTLYATKPEQYIRTQQLRLAAASGRSDIFGPWLATEGQTTNEQNLRDYFYTANFYKQTTLASEIAETLYQRAPTAENRNILIAAFVNSPDKRKALPYLRAQLQENPDDDGLYVGTLSDLARNDAGLRKELVNHAESRLKGNAGSSDDQLNYAYILISNGKRNVVRPIAREKAQSEGGKWRQLVAQLNPPRVASSASGQYVPPSTKQQIAMANNPKTSHALRQQIAFSLLQSGERAEALRIYRDMAEGKGPESQEVKDLLFIWGEKPPGDRMEWIIARASDAPQSERNAWSELVHNNTGDTDALRYTVATDGALHYQPLRQRFFNILARQGDGSNFTVRMRPWMEKTTDIAALNDFATTATNFGHYALAKDTYMRMETIAPGEKHTLSQLGTLAYITGDLDAAETYLSSAAALPLSDNSLQAIQAEARARYLHAQLLARNGEKQAAREVYAQVIDLEQRAAAIDGGLTQEAKTRVFTSLFHVGREKEGIRGFTSMLEANPHDRDTLANYLSVLMEYELINEALAASNRYDPKGRRFDSFSSRIRTMAEQYAANNTSKPTLVARGTGGYELHYLPTSATNYDVVREDEQAISDAVARARQQELRLQMIYAQLEQKSGQDKRARERLEKLAQYYPENPQLVAMRASAENASGNPVAALRVLEQARAIAPENEDFGRLERDIRRSNNTNFVRADHELRSFGKNNEHITTLSGATRVTDRTEIGFVAQNNAIYTKNFINRETGQIGEFDTTRQNAELYASYYYEDGSRIRSSLFANNDTPGIGFAYAWNNSYGRSEAIAEYHRPYADFTDAAFEHATRDRVGARHNGLITPRLSYGAEASLNMYNTHLADDVTRSGLIRGNLIYAVRQAQPYIGVGYAYDAEYLIGDEDIRFGQFNSVQRLLPLVSREVHAITGTLAHDLTDTTHVSLFGGWTYDRLGEQGPVIEGRLTEDLTDTLEAGVRARYGRQTNDSDNNATHLGGHVQYKF
jgi:Flp pilus assembly protein TadD